MQIPARRSRWISADPWLVTAVILIGIILRCSFLTHQSLWFDEIASIRMAQRSDLFRSDFHPPLYFSLLDVWILLFGTSEFAVRFLSALLGIISLLVVGITARGLLSRRGAAIAVLLTSCSFSHLWYSQEVRSYILLFLESAALLEIYRRWVLQPRSGRLTIALIGINTILLYTHYSAALLLFAQGCHSACVAFLQRSRLSDLKNHLSGYALVVLGTTALSLPLLPLIITQSSHVARGNLWLPPPALVDVYLLLPRLLFYTPGVLGKTTILLVNVFVGIALLYPVLERRGFNQLHFFIVIPPVFALLLSFFEIQMFAPKVLITILPAVIIACAQLLCRLPLKAVLVTSLAYIIAQGQLIYRYYTTPQKEGWRTIGAFLSAHAESGDGFYFTAPGTRLALEYYYPLRDEQIRHSIDERSDHSDKIWIIQALTPEPWTDTLANARKTGCTVFVQTRAAGVRVAGCRKGADDAA